MNRLVFSAVICFFLTGRCLAQPRDTPPAWASRYESVRASEGVFIVSKNGKMGTVNSAGTPLTGLVYDTICTFREGMAIVGRGHRDVNPFGKVTSDFTYGCLTKTGRLVVPIQHEQIEPYSEGLALTYSAHNYIYYDRQGRVALFIRHVYSSDPFTGGLAYQEVSDHGFWLAPYTDGRNNGSHTQLYDVNGETIYGNYIDHTGRLLVPWRYDTIAPYQPGYLRPVRKNGKWGFLDSLAQVAVALRYDDIDSDSSFFWQGLRRVGQGNQYGFLNPTTGRLVVPIQYEATLPSQRAVVWVRQHGRWGIIDSRRRSVIPPRYDEATPFDARGLAVVKQGRYFGLVDERGRELTPIQYDNILPFRGDRAVVRRAGQFGFIAPDGREVIPAVYDEVSQFADGQAFAKRWGLFITLDKNGNRTGYTLQTITLKWIGAVLMLLIGVSWWRGHKRKIMLPSR